MEVNRPKKERGVHWEQWSAPITSRSIVSVTIKAINVSLQSAQLHHYSIRSITTRGWEVSDTSSKKSDKFKGAYQAIMLVSGIKAYSIIPIQPFSQES